jgi:C-terminal processing protease CtpA/Prc
MRRFLVFLFLACVCAAETPEGRLAGAARLWGHIKYYHPRVTSPEIDWDAAFATAAPKIVAAQSDQQAAEIISTMLLPLGDPSTRLTTAADDPLQPMVFTTKTQDGVTIASLQPAPNFQAMQQDNVAERLSGAGPVVIDLRGERAIPLGSYLQISKSAIGPAFRFRVHSGYASPSMALSGSGFYRSSWEVWDGNRLDASEKPIRPVFLINSKTLLPSIVLAIQDAGAGPIVSEDEVTDAVATPPARVELWKGQYAAVRWSELQYPDGTTGFTVNRVLNKTGQEALADAISMAKSGNWPAAPPRAKLPANRAAFIEKAYSTPYPDEGIRMVAAARIWAVFSYFHPYKHLYDRDWDTDVLSEYLLKMRAARDAREYHMAVAEMVSHTQDTHCFVNSQTLETALGNIPAPIVVRWIENKAVVTRVAGPATSGRVEVGDVIVKVDGQPVQSRIDFIRKHTAQSTEQSAMYRAMNTLTGGEDGTLVRVTLIGADGAEREAEMKRVWAPKMYGREGEIFRLVDANTGYVDLTRLENAQVDEMFEKFRDTTTIIMDMRGYPRGTAWSIAPRLTTKQGMVAAQFRRNLVRAGPGGEDANSSLTFEQRIPHADKPRYAGKTVMLIDESAISQSEHSGLFYKTANGTTFIGSPTMGANGDVTYFMAPGNIRVNFSGHDVRWPDGRQLQRVGLEPDISVRPTIAGIRAGKDEVLERAVEFARTGK